MQKRMGISGEYLKRQRDCVLYVWVEGERALVRVLSALVCHRG